MDAKEAVRKVAMEVLKIATLERKRDANERHLLPAWQIERALIEAYERGYAEGQNNAEPD